MLSTLRVDGRIHNWQALTGVFDLVSKTFTELINQVAVR